VVRRRRSAGHNSRAGMWWGIGGGVRRSIGVGLRISRGWGVDACFGRPS
jgi:hypothetical protein